MSNQSKPAPNTTEYFPLNEHVCADSPTPEMFKLGLRQLYS